MCVNFWINDVLMMPLKRLQKADIIVVIRILTSLLQDKSSVEQLLHNSLRKTTKFCWHHNIYLSHLQVYPWDSSRINFRIYPGIFTHHQWYVRSETWFYCIDEAGEQLQHDHRQALHYFSPSLEWCRLEDENIFGQTKEYQQNQFGLRWLKTKIKNIKFCSWKKI